MERITITFPSDDELKQNSTGWVRVRQQRGDISKQRADKLVAYLRMRERRARAMRRRGVVDFQQRPPS